MSAQQILRDNIRELLNARKLTQKDLSEFCKHEPAWASKVLGGDRNVVLEDLAPISEFFGVAIADLFRHGISFYTERRTGADRRTEERRSGAERRQRGTTINLGRRKTDIMPHGKRRFE